MEIGFEFFIQLFIIVSMIGIGGRYGGIGLGVAGGLGMCILVLVFGLKPAGLPASVVFVILSVITCASVLQGAGGLDLLVNLAERALRKNPKAITFMGPFIASTFSIFCGTTYVAFCLYPVIAEVSAEAKIRPERPLSASVIAAGMGVVASPVSVATSSMVAILSVAGIGLFDILGVILPSFLIGVFFACLSVYKRGKELEQDPEFQRRVREGQYEFLSSHRKENEAFDPKALRGLLIFACGVLFIVSMGTMADFLPHYTLESGKVERLSTLNLIQMVMLATACLIMLFAKVPANKLGGENSVFRSGLVGVIGVFGVAWMTGTFFEAYKPFFTLSLSEIVAGAPYLFGFALFAFSMVVFSPSTTVAALMPVGLGLGIPPAVLVILYPCVCGDFIVPGANQIACVSFDRTGTTKIGKIVLNHSYMRPGFTLMLSATMSAYCISHLFF